MKKVNWSKAPEGTTHVVVVDSECLKWNGDVKYPAQWERAGAVQKPIDFPKDGEMRYREVDGVITPFPEKAVPAFERWTGRLWVFDAYKQDVDMAFLKERPYQIDVDWKEAPRGTTHVFSTRNGLYKSWEKWTKCGGFVWADGEWVLREIAYIEHTRNEKPSTWPEKLGLFSVSLFGTLSVLYVLGAL